MENKEKEFIEEVLSFLEWANERYRFDGIMAEGEESIKNVLLEYLEAKNK